MNIQSDDDQTRSKHYVTIIIIVGPFHKLRQLVAFPLRGPGFEPRSALMGFMLEKLAMGWAFSKYYGFPCQFSFH
jgi:hypothetical protein